jgi:hypothetical protein
MSNTTTTTTLAPTTTSSSFAIPTLPSADTAWQAFKDSYSGSYAPYVIAGTVVGSLFVLALLYVFGKALLDCLSQTQSGFSTLFGGDFSRVPKDEPCIATPSSESTLGMLSDDDDDPAES